MKSLYLKCPVFYSELYRSTLGVAKSYLEQPVSVMGVENHEECRI